MASRLVVFLLCGLCSYASAAALAGAQPETNQAQPQAAASTNAEQPVAAESSYGSYGYAPKYGGYQQPKYSSYGSEYAAPYVTGSCYGQYPGMYGNAEYDCKSYSVCQADGRLDVLYCPPYTRFNNYLGVCDWHFKVDSYCNPLYKEEPYNSYEKPSYGSYEKYESPKYSSYESPKYSNYEAPSYESYAPMKHSSYEAPSYGHRSVYKKY
ncbi:hypothetical protein RvY_14940 [Ramazzottius varieornatus]|uniref:Chitin-binding type-2 domain-containing protein n=1 Tax=Ramazzottius varieornatus TaxID=947166 RepID=A0A1D1VT18_RAMVA|nr:hypothetical protein RvY_14940 [Ramazzottius varieornatus]